MRKLLTLIMALFSLGLSAQTFNECDYNPYRTVFHLNAPTQPRLTIYSAGEGGKALKRVKMKRDGHDRWVATLKGDLKGRFYTFNIGRGETPGVFAKAVGINGRRAAIIDLKDTDPEHWTEDAIQNSKFKIQNFSDLVIYELHHRDFSIDPSSGLVNRGKFLALTEKKALRYLRDLGINAVHILPSYDYGSVDETRLDSAQYNWGYDPVNYNVPEGSYSTNPYDPTVRIREFKQMVQALHKAGIRVILDVVFNHTYDIPHSNFQRTYPDYYYRKNSDGTYSNGSGCGNETASEKPLMREFMKESVRYWIEQYHIDGFRFDLMGVHDIGTMNEIRRMVNEIDPTIYIYGEGWSAGQCALPQEKLAVKANVPQLNGIGAFSDDMRDALRGPFSDDTKGAFLIGQPGEEESLKFGLVGAIQHPQVDMAKVNYSRKPWANEPTQQISYVSCHDDMCLVDRLKAEGVKGDDIIKKDLLAQTFVFTSQGVPFMLSGEEMLRDKKGVHNSFNSPDSINHLDWTNLKRYPQVFQYYKNLIALRRHHPAFRLGKADEVRRRLSFLPTQPALVGFTLDGRGVDSWERIIVIFNGNSEAREVEIPEGQYSVVCCDGVINEDGLDTVEGPKVVVDGQSALILRK